MASASTASVIASLLEHDPKAASWRHGFRVFPAGPTRFKREAKIVRLGGVIMHTRGRRLEKIAAHLKGAVSLSDAARRSGFNFTAIKRFYDAMVSAGYAFDCRCGRPLAHMGRCAPRLIRPLDRAALSRYSRRAWDDPTARAKTLAARESARAKRLSEAKH